MKGFFSALLLLIATVGCARVRAAPQFGIVAGRVTDPDSRPVAEALVSIGRLTGMTNAEGFFVVRAVTPGVVSIAIAGNGLTERRLPSLTIRGGDSIFVAATMTRLTAPAAAPVAPLVVIHAIPIALHPAVVVDGRLVGRGNTLPDLTELRVARIESLVGIRPLELYGPIASGGLIVITTREPH